MRSAASARKHGIADEDMLHAVRFAIATQWQDDARLLHIGPSLSAQLLEAVVLDPDDDDPVIIHAEVMRVKWLYLLGHKR